jgi:hypothetical protein
VQRGRVDVVLLLRNVVAGHLGDVNLGRKIFRCQNKFEQIIRANVHAPSSFPFLTYPFSDF